MVGLANTAEDIQLARAEKERVPIVESIWDLLAGYATDPKVLEREGINSFDAKTLVEHFKHNARPTVTAKKIARLQGVGENAGEISLHGFTALVLDKVFVNHELLKGSFSGAARNYLHELAHRVSGEPNDFNSYFKETEKNMVRIFLDLTLADPQEAVSLKNRWDAQAQLRDASAYGAPEIRG